MERIEHCSRTIIGGAMEPRNFALIALSLGVLCGCSRSRPLDHGTLVAMGGGNGSPEIFEKWKNLGGGQTARVVLIPTANNSDEDVAPVINGLKQLFAV